MNLALVTYNIRLGIETSIGALAEAVAALGPVDVLALQEIGVRWRMGERIDQPAFLAQCLDMPYHAFAGALTDDTGGRFGVALVSRLPFASVDFTLLPRLDDEQRVLLHVVLDTTPRIHVFNTHLSILPTERALQAGRVAAAVAAVDGPVLVLGDFNDLPDSEVLACLRGVGPTNADRPRPMVDVFGAVGDGDALTFSVRHPNRTIDYVLCDDACAPLFARVALETRTSDHFPLLARVGVPGASRVA